MKNIFLMKLGHVFKIGKTINEYDFMAFGFIILKFKL
jgi:choline kinase